MGNIETTEEYHNRVRQERKKELSQPQQNHNKPHVNKPKELNRRPTQFTQPIREETTYRPNNPPQQLQPQQKQIYQERFDDEIRIHQPIQQEQSQMLTQSHQQMLVKPSYVPPVSNRPVPSQTQELSRQYDFGNINILNINDKIKDYKEYEKTEKQKFDEEKQKAEKEFNEKMRRTKNIFEREIELFERSNEDPYKILGLDKKDITLAKIRKAYKLKAAKNHPDKGGNTDTFKKITQSYCYLLNKYDEDNEFSEKIAKPVYKQDYKDIKKINDGYENIHLSKDNFNINKFNDLFNQFRLDDPDNDGYGDIMEKSEYVKDASIFNDEFNKKFFKDFDSNNRNTGDEADDADERNEMMVYTEPMALPSSGGAYQELGKGKINDFGGSNFTDYRRAYDKNSKFIEPDTVKYKQYKSVNELKADRESIRPLSKDELDRISRKEEMEAQKEKLRQQRLKEDEDRYNEQYNKINRLMMRH